MGNRKPHRMDMIISSISLLQALIAKVGTPINPGMTTTDVIQSA